MKFWVDTTSLSQYKLPFFQSNDLFFCKIVFLWFLKAIVQFPCENPMLDFNPVEEPIKIL